MQISLDIPLTIWYLPFTLKINRAYKTELKPNQAQRRSFAKHCGATRWVYNWGLGEKKASYEAVGKSPSKFDLSREITRLKKLSKEEGGVPWMSEIARTSVTYALESLDAAYKGFFRRCKNGSKQKGFPRFKSKKNGLGSFRVQNSGGIGIRVEESRIKLPKIGWVPLKEKGYLPTEGVKILFATVSEKADRWFVSITVEQDIQDPAPKPEKIIGIDLGSRKLSVTFDGESFERFENPKALAKYQRRLAHYERCKSRKVKGSQNRKKIVKKVQKVHHRIACTRRDAIHKMTTSIVKKASVIVLEDLNVAGMVKNRRVAKVVSDASFGEIRRQIEYKASWAGVTVVKASQWYPSSKTCSSCGHVHQELGSSEKFECPKCGFQSDRDENAARNLRALAGGHPVTACGETVRPGVKSGQVSAKQEGKGTQDADRTT